MTRDRDLALAEAVSAGRAVVARCAACENVFWHPRAHCPRCGAGDVELVTSSGPARVYAATVNRRPHLGGEGAPPAQVGFIEFPEGVRVLATLQFSNGHPTVGAEVVPVREGEGESLRLVFRPITGD